MERWCPKNMELAHNFFQQVLHYKFFSLKKVNVRQSIDALNGRGIFHQWKEPLVSVMGEHAPTLAQYKFRPESKSAPGTDADPKFLYPI